MIRSDANSYLLQGLDGSNSLAFLAALGTLRILTKMHPHDAVSMGWRIDNRGWRPFLTSSAFPEDHETFCDSLAVRLASPPQMELFAADEIGDNLKLSPDRFRELALKYLSSVNDNPFNSMAALEYLAAFGTDAAHQPHSKDRSLMQDTALRTMSGAGHQHFIKFMREIIANTSASHLYSTLFCPWSYEDEGRGMNLRWDPNDDRRYAMRWKNPSSDPATTMRGANRLAIEGLPFFPSVTIGRYLQTTGFRSKQGSFWSWPIWEGNLEMPVIQSLLQLAFISDTQNSEQRKIANRQGIAAVFKSQRIRVGKFRSFTPAKSV